MTSFPSMQILILELKLVRYDGKYIIIMHLLSGNDVVSTHVFDGDTMLLTRRCNNVVFKLNDVATSFQLVFNVETTSVCPLGVVLFIK